MYDRESGDMLPRAAPKPTSPPRDDMFKPAVPELSILFDQKNEKQQQAENAKQKDKSPPKKVQSYAAWKRQMLPPVSFPQSERENLHNEMQLNDLYPMRQTVQPIPVYNNYDNLPYYFHDGSPNAMISRPVTAPMNTAAYQQALYAPQRRSLDDMNTQRYNTVPLRSSASEVLTLCASTQTDAELERHGETISPQTLRQFASKSDVDRLMEVVQKIRQDQLRLMLICETLAAQQQQQQKQTTKTNTQPRTQTNEAATQSEQKTGTYKQL